MSDFTSWDQEGTTNLSHTHAHTDTHTNTHIHTHTHTHTHKNIFHKNILS